MKKIPEINSNSSKGALWIETKTPDIPPAIPALPDNIPIGPELPDGILDVPELPDKAPAVPGSDESLDSVALSKTGELKQRLVMNGVPGEWFDEQLQHETFEIYANIDRYFQKSAEKQVDHDKKHDASWYFARLDVDAKIEKGKKFMEAHNDIFKKAEARHGIHRELIAAIVGVETNFADHHQRGKFYAFNSLVSQYVFTNRKKFAVRELTALYKFSHMTGRSPQYFTSSYAGAIGWGQFIPSSLLAFFIDANGVREDADPFSLEDTIFSVENYLYEHNLSGRNIDDYNARYKAVFAYNHSDIYVKAVLFVYDGLREYFRTEVPDISADPFEDATGNQPAEVDSPSNAHASQSLKIRNRYSALNPKRPFRPRTRYIILHTTEGALEGSLRKVRRYGEAHYFVTPSGEVYRIIDRRKIATHTGRSMWNGQTTLDNSSIGIEVVGFYNRDITEAQYAALRELLRQLKSLYGIKDKNILTHSMVAYGRPNRFHENKHRGRKRCGMIFAHPDVRRRLGLSAGPARDPDVAAQRLVVADPELHRFLYRPPVVLAASVTSSSRDGPVVQYSDEPMVIEKGVTAWRIARERYDDPSTIYVYPDGKRFQGNEIREWDNIPKGTRIQFLEDDQEQEQEFEGFLEIGKDGKTARDLAGHLYADATTIYFFPKGLIRTGAELKRTSSLRKLFEAPPKGTRVLVGYIYGGYVKKGRSASRIAGKKWNYPSTFYRLPDGRILSGDEIDDKSIQARTLIFLLK
ncbi:MAG: lytic murein transglycosylase [Deltaproteobacteria bacterium]|nr:lytic murein transglycosylase [Deltaproteobacteria bacterium]